MDSDSTPPLLPPPPPFPLDSEPVAEPSFEFDWRYWMRRLLVCNPFFLCSAALLLFGVSRLSLDSNFLGDEKANLLFNYSALHLYGFLVAGTALVLARKKIWYDSALLVVVENGLVLVPFMLISQGALLKPGLGVTLALGGVLLAVMRALAIRRWYPQFNLPSRALALGGVLLLVNAALPLIYPRAVLNDTGDWATPNLVLWYLFLPLLVGGANFLPKPTRYGGLNPERQWLPLFIYALWVAGTGGHFWCLGHISNLPFDAQHLGPAVLVAVWTLYRRLGDCVLVPSVNWQRALLCLAFAAPLVSFQNSDLFEALVVANAIAFGALFIRGTTATRTFARELLVLCIPLAAIGMPDEIGRRLMPLFGRSRAIVFGLSLLTCISALRWFRVRLGMAGALAAMALVTLVWPAAPPHAFVETALLFLLTHSLAWRKDVPGAAMIRASAGLVWLVDAAMWIHTSPWRTDARVMATALILLAAWFLIWRVSKQLPNLIVAISAASVFLCAPTDWLIRHGSLGLIALAASVALFAIGFVVAWTRHHWEQAHDPPA